jgi:hypothetical protein
MIIYRIDIKNNAESSIFLNRLLKLLVAVYIIAAFGYLMYKFYTLSLHHTSDKEWAAITINLLIIVVLALQLLKTVNKKYILITDEFVKYRWRFPWASQIDWKKIKTIQLGYSSVRFITKSEKRYRFYFSKATDMEKTNLQDALIEVAQKHEIEFMQPI